jgi:hypothetical protein
MSSKTRSGSDNTPITAAALKDQKNDKVWQKDAKTDSGPHAGGFHAWRSCKEVVQNI